MPSFVRIVLVAALVTGRGLHGQDTVYVRRVLPEGDLRPSSTITISFNRPLAGTLERLRNPAEFVRLEPAIVARMEWRDPATIRIVPREPLTPGSALTVRASGPVATLLGDTLVAGWSKRFFVRPPAVVGSVPGLHPQAPGQLEPDGRLLLRLSGAVDTVALRQSARLVGSAACSGMDGDIRFDVKARAPSTNDPWQLQGHDVPRDSVERRFDQVVELTPVRRPPEGCTLDFEAALPDGPQLERIRYQVRTALSFAMAQVRCANARDCAASPTLQLSFTAPVRFDDVRRYLTFSPAGVVTLPDSSPPSMVWSFPLSIRPGQRLTVTADARLRDVWDRAPSGTRELVMTAGDRIPAFSINSGLTTVARGTQPILRVRHVNVDSLTLTMVVDPRPVAISATQPAADEAVFAAATRRVTMGLRLDAPRNSEQATEVPLRLPDEWRNERVLVLAAAAGVPQGLQLDGETQRVTPGDLGRPVALIQSTDLMVHARGSAAGGGVFVTNVRTGAPVQNARVRVYDDELAVVAAGVTSAEGLVRLVARPRATAASAEATEGEIQPGNAAWPYRATSAVEVTTASDHSVVALGSTMRILGRRGPMSWPGWWGGLPIRRRAVVSTDRGIYRPGEKVFFTGVVRDGWLDALRAPAGEPVRWRVYRPDDGTGETRLLLRTANLSRFGVHADSLTLPMPARLGTWMVRLERKQGRTWTTASEASFEVAEYRAPEFLVNSTLGGDALVRGDTARATVAARLLFDAPLSGGAVIWNAWFTELQPWEIRIPGLPPGWSVGQATSWWEGANEQRSVYVTGNDSTRRDGTALVVIPTDTMRSLTRGARLAFSVAVTDRSGQPITSTVSTTVAPASFYLAAKPEGDGWTWRAGREEGIRVGAITPAGVWQSGMRAQVTVTTRRWIPRGGAWGFNGWDIKVDTVGRDSLVVRDTATVWRFAPETEGIVEVEFRAQDTQGRETVTSVSRYVFGKGGFVWQGDPTTLRVFAARDSVKVGEALSMSFSSPFEEAQAWVTVEREGVLTQERHLVRGGENTLRLRVQESWIPEAVVNVVLVRMGDLTRTDSLAQRYRAGAVRLVVDRAPRALQVALKPARPEYKPGETATIQVSLRDAWGRPVQGEAVVWAADEGVLSLTGFTTPALLQQVYTEGAPGLAFGTTLTSLALELARLRGEGYREFRSLRGVATLQLDQVVVTSVAAMDAADMAKVGRADSVTTRSDFRSTAFFKGAVITNAAGLARVRVKLPDNITTYRLMAVAVDARDRAGSGEAPLVVTKPLLVRAALPRFVRVTDTFQAGGVVNTRGRSGVLPTRVSATGEGALSLTGAVARNEQVVQNGTLTRFDWIARPGTSGKATLAVSGGGLQDAVALELPVRPDQHARAQSIVALVRDSTTLRFTLPTGIDPVRSRLTIRVGPTPLPVIRTWVSYLDTYAYACTEQLASAARGVIALLQLHQARAARLPDVPMLRVRLHAIVRQLATRQRVDGSFGYWSSGSWTTPQLSTYVGEVLLDARDLDIAVPQEVIDRLERYLSNAWNSQALMPDTTYGTRRERQRTIQGHLGERLAQAEFLVRVGKPVAIDDMVGVQWGLTFEDRARLALHLKRASGRDPQASTLLDLLWQSVTIVGNRVDMPDSTLVTTGFPSRIRPAALLLRATQAINPNHPGIGPLAQRIIQRERAEMGAWWNTQDYAYAAAAVAGFMRGDAAAATPYRMRGSNGAVIASGVAGDTASERSMDLARLTFGRGNVVELPISVIPVGGPLYVTLTVREELQERPVAPDARGLIVERWYERYTDGATVTEVQEGDLVRVRLRITAPSDREFVAIEDPLPAGLEIVDPKLRTSSLSPFLTPEALQSDRRGDAEAGRTMGQDIPWRLSWGWWPWDSSEAYDDRMVFHARTLGSGSHALEYVVRATTPGRFVRPQAWAEEMYNPALNGASDGGWFIVKAR